MLLFLIGYMGCGKSTIGRKLSTRLDWDLIDTDSMIERREGMSVGDIFDRYGEEHFRSLERNVLEEIISRGRDCIVSTGGGLPLWGDNMSVMNGAGETIYLCRTAKNIASRLSPRGRAKRPKIRDLSDDELVAFMSENIEQRDVVYRQSNMVVEAVPLSDDQILDVIVARVNSKK